MIAEQLDIQLTDVDPVRLVPERHARAEQLAAGMAIADFRAWRSDDPGRLRAWLCGRALKHDGPLGLLRDAVDALRRSRRQRLVCLRND